MDTPGWYSGPGKVRCADCVHFTLTDTKARSGLCDIASRHKLPAWVEKTVNITGAEEGCDFGQTKPPTTTFVL